MRVASMLLAVCCCLSATSLQWQQPMTALPDEHPATSGAPVASTLPQRSGARFGITIGTLDTIGGTTYDWFTSGPICRMLVRSPGYGVHAVWMYSCETNTQFTDRNMRYNFYDVQAGQWNWIESDHIWSGVLVFDLRAGYGNIDVAPNGEADISCHYSVSGNVSPRVARDAAPGAGIFEYADGSSVLGACQWPPISTSDDGTINIFPITIDYDLSYGHIAPDDWPNFSARLTGITPSPGFPSQNIAASKQSGKVCLVWEVCTDTPEDAHLQTSTDHGATWASSEQIPTPNAFGGDTLTAFHITSLFPFYDSDDRLNIVAGLLPRVNDTTYIIPSQIWHYCPDNSPQWNRIHIAGCDPTNLEASVGYNAAYACRPSIGQDDYGNLYVTWEQFDSANVEVSTNRLRADIWASGSTDGGITWSAARKLTDAESTSCRFPSVSDMVWPGDSLAVLYQVDLCAGFFVQGEGPGTENPIVVQKVPIDSMVELGPYYGRLREPNGGESLYTGDTFAIKWVVTPKTFDHGVLLLSTDGGNTFPTVLDASIPPTETMALWDSIPQASCSLCRVKFVAIGSTDDTVFSDVSYRNFQIDSVFVGVSGDRPGTGSEARPAPTVVRGVLMFEPANGEGQRAKGELLNAAGRKVLDLKLGANDIRALAPGVYFVRRQGSRIQGFEDASVDKVVITR